MNLFRISLFALLLGVFALPAAAESPFSNPTPLSAIRSSGKPLMVIRFNQRKVHFERQLYSVLEQVVAIKPNVMFDIVSVIPEGADNARLDSLKEIANQNGTRVAESMVRMGVPTSRFTYNERSDPKIRFNEVRLYAR